MTIRPNRPANPKGFPGPATPKALPSTRDPDPAALRDQVLPGAKALPDQLTQKHSRDPQTQKRSADPSALPVLPVIVAAQPAPGPTNPVRDKWVLVGLQRNSQCSIDRNPPSLATIEGPADSGPSPKVLEDPDPLPKPADPDPTAFPNSRE